MRKAFFRRTQRPSCTRLRALCVVFLTVLPIGAIWYLTAVSALLNYKVNQPTIKSGKALFSVTASKIRCVSWRQTAVCSPFG